jgi:predicted ATPase/class 3 adenylate cyclase
MTEREQIEQAIAALEAQRVILGDAVVETALAPLYKQLSELDQVEAAAPRLRAERRLVTVMFADVSGFTAMSEAMDPEAVRDVMNACFECLVPVVERYGGTVDKFIGDEIMALFGAPVAHEDDPVRALRAALDMMGALETFNVERGTDLGLHFGINTGHVIAGGLGTREREEYSVMGDAVNVAARLEDLSERGEILVGPDTQRLTAPLFEYEARPAIRVKGKREPMTVYRLLRTKAVRGKVRGIEGLASALVGRDAELEAMQEAVERLHAGIGGIVTLVGEAGLGKSRLVAEIGSSVIGGPSSADVRWIEGRCLSYGGSIAYLPWLDVLRGLLGIAPDDEPAAVRDTLRERVGDICPEQFDDVYPFLAHLFSLPPDDEARARLRGVEGEGLQTLTFRAIGTLIEHAAGQQPLVIVCEDLHWADPTSVEMLERLLTLTDRAAVLFLCVLRPETEHACWRVVETAARRYRHRHSDLRLDPLSVEESAALVGNLLHVEDLPSALRERLLDHAEGNPFYVEELIRSLIDGGAIVQDAESGRWRAAPDVEDIAISDTLHGVLVARIDRLQEETRRILQLASVIGRVFLYRVLAEIAQQEREVAAHLLTLQRETLIREHARVPELEYAFKHQLTQEAAYSGILRQERRAYHRQVAESLERLFADRLDEVLGLLAYHWERAEETQQAAHYLRRAGEQAAAQFANAGALDYLGRALELTPAADVAGRYVLLSTRAGIYDLQGRWALQGQDLAQLAMLATALDESDPQPGRSRQAEVAVQQAVNADRAGRGAKRLPLAQRAVDLAQAAQDLASEALGYQQWAYAILGQGFSESFAKLEQALTLCQRAHLTQVETRILLSVGDFLKLDTAKAQPYYQRALRLCQETGNRRGEAAAHRRVGDALRAQGKLAEAIPYLERSLQLCRAMGDRLNEGWALQTLGEIRLEQGRYAEGAAYCEQALEVFRDIEGRTGLDSALWTLVIAAQDRGQTEKALAYVEQAVRHHRETGDQKREGHVLEDAGNFLTGLGKFDRARDYLDQALQLVRKTGDRWGEGWALYYFAQYHSHLGDYDRAQASAEQSLHLRRDINWMPGVGQSSIILGLIAHNRGDDETAQQLGEQALHRAQEANWSGLESLAWRVLGDVAAGLGQWDEAAQAYTNALELAQVSVGARWQRRRNQDRAIEHRAGLARVALAQADAAGALTHVAAILGYLRDYPVLRCAYEPLRVYLTCYRVLHANADARARDVLNTAYGMLQERAANIADEELRRSYLENVAAHREIVVEWKRLAAPGSTA